MIPVSITDRRVQAGPLRAPQRAPQPRARVQTRDQKIIIVYFGEKKKHFINSNINIPGMRYDV